MYRIKKNYEIVNEKLEVSPFCLITRTPNSFLKYIITFSIYTCNGEHTIAACRTP